MRALPWLPLLSVLALSAAACSTPGTDPMDAAVPMEDVGNDAFMPDRWAPDVFVPDDPGPARAIFVLDPPADAFFDMPWPSDARVDATGHPILTGFQNPRSTLVDDYIAAIEQRQIGFATNGTVYFRFSRHVDESTLPADLAASLDDAASVFLLDVDPDSPDLGTHLPIVWHYQQLPTLYWQERTLAIRTPDGMPLAADRTYAVVVTSRVHAEDGTAFGRDDGFSSIIDGTAPAATLAAYQPALNALTPTMLNDVISLAVFTTEDPTGLAMQLRDYVRDTIPTPAVTAAGYARGAHTAQYNVVEGHYGPVPIFQSGTIPYVDAGGAIDLDDGTIVEGTFDARFALSIPTTPMPPGGYPIVLYSHGTGGDYHSFLTGSDNTAGRLAALGIAVMGIDQIHHGERNPTMVTPDQLFFNVTNPDAVRFNTLESAVDIVSQARFAAALDIPVDVIDRGGAQVRIDASRMYFFGHSQGGLVAPLYLAIDDATHGGVISEGGGLVGYALTLKTQPISIPALVATALGLRTLAGEEFTLFHPVIALIQGWIEPSEPTNYAPFLFDHPRTGFAPKSIFMTEGGMDPYTPPPSIEALAVAMRIPQVDPISHRIATEDFLGIPPAGASVMGNVAGGMATAALLQFPNEGHFAVFENADCQARYTSFFTSLVTTTGPGTIPAAP